MCVSLSLFPVVCEDGSGYYGVDNGERKTRDSRKLGYSASSELFMRQN